MARFLQRLRGGGTLMPVGSHTVAEYRGRHGNADVEVRTERSVRERVTKDYREIEVKEIRHARARVWNGHEE
jgi:hypothetical protein